MKQTSTKRMIVILTATFFAIMIAWFLSQTGMQVNAATLDKNSKTWSENSEIDTDVIIDGGVIVDANITLTIRKDKTLIVNGGINAKDKTLTVEGEGKLVVKGSDGNDGINGSDGSDGGYGSDGGNGFTGNLVVNGADVTVSGGKGGEGGEGGRTNFGDCGVGGVGGSGGSGVVGTLTVNSGSAFVNGGVGGMGGVGGSSSSGGGRGGSGGSGGNGVAGILTVNNGSAIVNGGVGGKGGKGGYAYTLSLGGFSRTGDGGVGGDGGSGGCGVADTLIVNSGSAIVNGGVGGSGGDGDISGTSSSIGRNGGSGGVGGSGGNGVAGTLTVNSGSAIVNGGVGGSGGNGGKGGVGGGRGGSGGNGGNGGHGGYGVDGTVTVSGGSATVTGGNGGNGGGRGGLYNSSSGGKIGDDGGAGVKAQAITSTITATTIKESVDNSTWEVIDSGTTGTISKKQYVKAETVHDTYTTSGDITFSGKKTLEGRDLTKDDAFSFELYELFEDKDPELRQTVTNGEDGKYTFYKINYSGDDLDTDKDGNYVETTKKYKVVEKAGKIGGITYDETEYEIKVTLKDDGKGKITVTADPAADACDFTNSYETKGNITFSGNVKLNGKALTGEDAFKFEIWEGNTVVGRGENDATGKITFTSIEYVKNKDRDDTGVHNYTVKQVTEDGAGITVDTKEYSVGVEVIDKGDGKLTVNPSEEFSALYFTNQYRATGQGEVKVKKILSGRDWQTDDSFEFTIKPVGNDLEFSKNPITVTNESDDHSGSFGKVDFTKAGTYQWTVSETNKGKTIDGLAYDSKDRTVTIEVKDDGKGNLVAEEGSNLVQTAEFTNTQHTGNLEITKNITVNGSPVTADHFAKVDGDYTFAVTNGDMTITKDVTITIIDGKSNTETIEGLPPGTYTVSETDSKGLVPDQTSKTVTIEAGKTTEIAFTNNLPGTPDIEKKVQDSNGSTGETSDWQDSADYDMDDKVPFKLTATLPGDVTSYRRYHITFEDEMEEGLTFNGIDRVIVEDKELSNQDYEFVKNSDRNFSLKLTWGDGREKITDRSLNGANVEVYYTATLNEKTRLGREGNLNGARLRYSSNPNDSDDEEVTSWDYVDVFTYSLTLYKVDESDLALEGAEFKLEKRLADGTLRSIFLNEDLSAGNQFTWSGLDDGTYVLTETKTPNDYKEIDPITFEVKASHMVVIENLSPDAAVRKQVLDSLTGQTTGSLDLQADADLTGLFANVKNEPALASAEGEVKVKKILSGRDWKDKDSFEFTITPINSAPAFVSSTITVIKDSADHTGSFGKVKITKEGTYQWTVSETNKGKTIDGLAYDREDKTVTIKVKKGQNGKLVAEEGSSLVQTAEFTNRRAITVRWLDGDGKTELDTATYLAGEDQPPFSGNTPEKEADQDYVYTFSGWDQGSENGDTITYNPLFDKKGRTYGAPNWEWTGNDQEGYSAAKASFTTNDGEKEFTLSEKDEQVAVDRTEASCIEDGKVVYTATVTFRGKDYKDEKEVILKATGHDMKETEETPATCTQEGQKAYFTCGNCHKTFADKDGEKEITEPETIPAIGHDWGEWVILKQPMSTKEGEKERTCKNDPSHVEKKTIPAIGEKKTSGTLLLRMTAKGKKRMAFTWTKVTGADGYDLFMARCNHRGRKTKCKYIRTFKAGQILAWTKKELKKHTAYKAFIRAYVIQDGNKKYVKTSPAVHAYTGGYCGSYTNPRSLKIKKKKISLTAGNTTAIKAEVTKLKKGKKLMTADHAPKLRYISSDPGIVTVSRSGRITAKGKGSCRIYVITVNGLRKTVQITVK